MSKTYTGGCACGSIRYEAAGAPVTQLHCQCRHCQMRSGTGHSSYIVFAGEDSVTINGNASSWGISGDGGNEKNHAFCPTCGTPVYLTFPAMPGVTAMHAGSLDKPDSFAPEMVTYTASGPAWDRQDPDLVMFEKMPEA